MTFSAATVAAHAREERRSTDSAIRHHAQQAVIAYRNRENWPQAEARAALDLSIAHLARLLRV